MADATRSIRRREYAPGRYRTCRIRVRTRHGAWLVAYAAPWAAMTVIALAGGLEALTAPARSVVVMAMVVSLAAVVAGTCLDGSGGDADGR